MRSDSWAVQYHRYGGPDVLVREPAAPPTPRPFEVRVRVVATGVNRLDLVYRSGTVRGLHGVGFPKGTGFELLGIVETACDAIPDAPVGQLVWGMLGIEPTRRRGTVAEFATLRRGQFGILLGVAPDPDLAALPLAAATALAALRDCLKVLPGHRLLVVGASGGVGTAALQLAKILGAEVDAVASSRNHTFCRELGATDVFSYDARSPSLPRRRYDAVLIAAGDPLDYARTARLDGRLVCLAGDAWVRSLPSLTRRRVRPRPTPITVGPRASDLDWLGAQVRSKRLRPIVERAYPLRDIALAHRDQQSGHGRGRRIVANDESAP